MECKLCKSTKIHITYRGLIRDGGLGKYTAYPVSLYQCEKCGVIWHDPILDTKTYYESQEYRNSLEGTSEEEEFYKLHDKEIVEKFQYTGTDIFRHKIVADIGCGGGAFLDFISGVADEVIGVEPSAAYRDIMKKKGIYTYAYTSEANKIFANKVNIVTSFDVIEHVDDPMAYLSDIYELLCPVGGGTAIVGTPTETPVMRRLLGSIYEKKLLFSTQHLWVFGEKSLRMMAERVGFKNIQIKFFQRYGIGNLLGWLREKEPQSDIKDKILTETMNRVWKSECEAEGLSDYIVLYASK